MYDPKCPNSIELCLIGTPDLEMIKIDPDLAFSLNREDIPPVIEALKTTPGVVQASVIETSKLSVELLPGVSRDEVLKASGLDIMGSFDIEGKTLIIYLDVAGESGLGWVRFFLSVMAKTKFMKGR
jgi:hypothetical protein